MAYSLTSDESHALSSAWTSETVGARKFRFTLLQFVLIAVSLAVHSLFAFGVIQTEADALLFVASLQSPKASYVLSMFTHISPGHLIMNMLCVVFMMRYFSELLGFSLGMISLMISSFLTSAIVLDMFPDQGLVGMSGAICFSMGFMTLNFQRTRVTTLWSSNPQSLFGASVGMIILMWFISLFGVPISNSSHVVGYLLGVVFGVWWRIER